MNEKRIRAGFYRFLNKISERGAAFPAGKRPLGENLSVSADALPLPGLRHPASAALCLRLAGRCPNSDSLFPPLAGVVVVAPIEERLWHFAKLFLFARGSPW